MAAEPGKKGRQSLFLCCPDSLNTCCVSPARAELQGRSYHLCPSTCRRQSMCPGAKQDPEDSAGEKRDWLFLHACLRLCARVCMGIHVHDMCAWVYMSKCVCMHACVHGSMCVCVRERVLILEKKGTGFSQLHF